MWNLELNKTKITSLLKQDSMVQIVNRYSKFSCLQTTESPVKTSKVKTVTMLVATLVAIIQATVLVAMIQEVVKVVVVVVLVVMMQFVYGFLDMDCKSSFSKHTTSEKHLEAELVAVAIAPATRRANEERMQHQRTEIKYMLFSLVNCPLL